MIPEKNILHEEVEDYCQNQIAEPDDAYYLHEEIDNEDERGNMYDCFIEYIEDKFN